MLALELRPGMTIKEGKTTLRILELPFPCSPYTKVHVKAERKTSEGKKVEIYCYDRNADVMTKEEYDAAVLS